MIEPRYQSDRVTLYCADCLDVLPQLEAGSVAIVADPPYGIGESMNDNASRGLLAVSRDYGYSEWDKERISKHAISELLRAGKSQVIFGGNYYADLLPPSSSWIVWNKLNGKTDFADCELAWTSHSKAVRKIDWMWHGMIRRGNDIRYHPTQKPEGVMRWVIENYTGADDLVLDPFMGSGTTGVAAMQLGRKFIGIEIDPTYYAIAEKRIKAAESQLLLGI